MANFNAVAVSEVEYPLQRALGHLLEILDACTSWSTNWSCQCKIIHRG